MPGSAAFHLIVDHFGADILSYNEDGSACINRSALGNIIFNNAMERSQLNNITHPRIRIVLLKKVIYNFLIGNNVVVLDTPLLFEAGLYRWVHSTIVVYCPQQLQFERLMQRDGINQVQARAKIDSQMPIDQKKALANHVVDNSTTIQESTKQAKELITSLTPSRLSVFLMWILFFWPAFWLYALFSTYEFVDKLRYVGIGYFKKTIPKAIKKD